MFNYTENFNVSKEENLIQSRMFDDVKERSPVNTHTISVEMK